MTVSLETETEVPFSFDYEKTAKEVINFTLAKDGFPFEAQISLLLTDDEGIRQLNKEYRQTDRATDVLSFPMISYETAGDFSKLEADDDNFDPDTGEAVLGDIVISVERTVQQAESYGHSELREFAFLIVHSMLHLFGYDHMTGEDAAVMEPKQEKILEEMHILREDAGENNDTRER